MNSRNNKKSPNELQKKTGNGHKLLIKKNDIFGC